MGHFWVEWDLPADRDVAIFWRVSLGQDVVHSATDHDVEVRSSFASKQTCHQNKYGIWRDYHWGRAFPSTNDYDVQARDVCMHVAVEPTYGLFDAPTNNSDWPNASGGYQQGGPPFLSVWLR